MPIDTKYLSDAKETIDNALAIAESGFRLKYQIDKALVEAGDKACLALKQLMNHSEYWAQFTTPTNHSANEALEAKILQRKEHFEIAVLPVCGKVLARLGFKPPEDAQPFVERAQKACRSLKKIRTTFVRA